MLLKKIPSLLGVLAVFAVSYAPFAYSHTAEIQQAREEVKASVADAADYIAENGPDDAFTEFSNMDSDFYQDHTFIFAIDYAGDILATPIKPELIGTNQYNAKSSDGKHFIKDMIAMAKSGGGWVKYRVHNPRTSQEECKNSYVMPMNNDNYLIGSGYYYIPMNKAGKCL